MLQQTWNWSERHATQPEILRYANHVADSFDLRAHITFNTRVLSARFDEAAHRWQVTTDTGTTLDATYLVLATGCLSNANQPDIEGLDTFAGPVHHTGQWPHDGVDFSNQRVGVIGTGSSGIQAIPLIAQDARHLTVFQRTAHYSIPAGNSPLDAATVAEIKSDYAGFRARNNERPGGFGSRNPVASKAALEATAEEHEADFEQRWQHGGFGFLGGFTDLWSNAEANALAAEFIRDKIRHIVDDPLVAETLCPEQAVGCKRICLDTGYYETFNRANVRLKDIRSDPILAVTPTGLETRDETFELDTLVCATGFDALTGALLAIDIRGRDGLRLQDKWAEGPRTYLGLTIEGFPNLFALAGPGSPSVLTNMMVAIDQHVCWVAECIEHMRASGLTYIEAKRAEEEAWVTHGSDVAQQTLYPTCNSWYVGANIPGKPRVFLPYVGGFPAYRQKCAEVAARGYEGFRLR